MGVYWLMNVRMRVRENEGRGLVVAEDGEDEDEEMRGAWRRRAREERAVC